MKKQIIKTDTEALGPYSQGVRVGHFLFTAGQIGRDPVTGEMAGQDITSQTHQVLKNLNSVLVSAGSDLNHVVKTTVFLQSMNDFVTMNEVYAGYFDADPPARTTVAVARLPAGALVEIEAVAVIPGNG